MNDRLVALGAALAIAAGPAAHAATPPSDTALNALLEKERIREVIVGFENAHDSTDEAKLRQMVSSDAELYENGKLIMSGDKVPPTIVADQHRLNPGLADGKFGFLRHYMTNIEITLLSDDSAIAFADCLVTGYDKVAGQPVIVSTPRYSEQFVKRDGRWQLRKLEMNNEQRNDAVAKAMGLGKFNPLIK